jgi:putative PEP-CTERM system TPR-repeat lipoprotein
MQLGEAQEAARYFQQAAALDPKNLAKRTAAAVSRLGTSDTEHALRDLEAISVEDTAGGRADLAVIAVHIQRREYDKALAAVAALEKKRPNDPQPHNVRAAILLAKKDVAGARRSFEKALQLDPTFFPAAANLARLDLADKRPDDAKKRFEAVLAKNPRHVEAQLALAALSERAGGKPEEVAALIEKAVAADPAALAPRAALVAYYLRVKDPKRALTAAQNAAAAMPESAEVLDMLGQAQQAAGETNQALTSYNKLASMRPESPLPLLRIAQLQAAEKKNDAALESIEKALKLKPDLLEAQRAAMALQLAAGRRAEAVAIARTVQRQRPKEAAGYLLEGDAHAAGKAWAEAEAAYRSGLKAAPGPELSIKVHAVQLAAGKTGEADKFAAAWLKDHPKDLAFRQYLAERATAAKNYSAAMQHYREILDQRPNNPLVLNNMAWVAGQLKDPQALDYARKADSLAPNTPAILDTLGVLLVERGEYGPGLEALRKAVQLAPEAAVLRLNLAKGLLKSGDKAGARKELESLAALGEKFPAQAEVTQMLKDL